MPLLDIALKSSVLLLLAALAAGMTRRYAAAHRHFIWMLVMTGLLALPVLSMTLPWRLPVLPAANGCVVRGASCVATANAAASIASPSAALQADEAPPRTTHNAPRTPSTIAPAQGPIDWPGIAASLARTLKPWWIAGLLFALVRLLLSAAALVRLMRGSREVEDAEWQRALARAADRLGVRAPVRLLESPRASVPMTFGIRHPVIVLPLEARDWDAELRDVVLLHELAHVRRGDAGANLVCQVACAIYWFHPLVWGAARRLRIEAERACDDLVISAGAPPSAYANHLLGMVQAIARLRAPALAMPLAQRSAFEGRVLAILEPHVPRQSLSARAAALGFAALVAVAVPLAALSRADVAAPQEPAARAAERAATRAAEPVADRSAARIATRVETHVETQTATRIAERVAERVGERAGKPERDGQEPSLSTAAIAALVVGMHDADADVRAASAHALGEHGGDTAAINALVEALRHDTSRDVRKTAAWALGQIEDARAVPGLLASLRDERDKEVRRQVVWALGQIESEDAVAGLGAALRGEDDPETRHMIVWAFGQIEKAEAVPFLTPLLRDADPAMREKAAWALGQIEDHASVDAIVAALASERVSSVRSQLIWALGQIEDRRAAPALEAALRDENVEVRRKAVWALGQLDNLGAAPAGLLAALRDSDVEVRRGAAHALSQLEDPASVPALVTAMHDDDLEVRRNAVHALGEIRGANAVEALVAAMRDPDPEIRRLAAHALGNR